MFARRPLKNLFIAGRVLVRELWAVVSGRSRKYDGVMIRGDEAFIQATIGALELLKARTPDVYALLKKHLALIVAREPSGVFVIGLAHFPTTMVDIGPAYSTASPVEYAGALAHETYHCELYRRAEQSAPSRRVPKDAYLGRDAESQCLTYQCDALRRLGLDEARIDLYQKSLELKWWEVPIEQRNW